MEECITRKVMNNEVDETIETMAVFDWKVTGKDIQAYKTTLSFSRDTKTPYYQKVVELEKKWKKETEPSSLLTYIFVGLSFATMTAFLIITLLLGFQLIYFLTIMVPALLLFTAGAMFFYLRTKKIQKIIISYYERRREYRLEIEKIKKES